MCVRHSGIDNEISVCCLDGPSAGFHLDGIHEIEIGRVDCSVSHTSSFKILFGDHPFFNTLIATSESLTIRTPVVVSFLCAVLTAHAMTASSLC